MLETVAKLIVTIIHVKPLLNLKDDETGCSSTYHNILILILT